MCSHQPLRPRYLQLSPARTACLRLPPSILDLRPGLSCGLFHHPARLNVPANAGNDEMVCRRRALFLRDLADTLRQDLPAAKSKALALFFSVEPVRLAEIVRQ